MLLKVNKWKSVIYFSNRIKGDVLRIAVFSLVTGLISYGKYFSNLLVPLALVAIVGTAISVLLTFRTSQAYDRWWEARTVWGSIVNDSRTFVRQLQLFLPAAQSAEVRGFAKRQIVWCHALTHALRREEFEGPVAEYVAAHGLENTNIPNEILAQHSWHLKRLSEAGYLSEFREVQLDATLSKLCDAMGRCERIKNTIFPENYGKLIHLLIYFFALMLPFALDDNFIYVKTVLTICLPTVFIMIEQTAILMQNPFESEPMDTPMTTISHKIETDLLELIGEKNYNEPVVVKDYYFIL